MTRIETERLVIKNFTPDDWQALHEMIIQYQASEYAIYDQRWPTSEEEIKRVAEWFAGGDSYLAVFLRDTGCFVGFVSLNQKQDSDCRAYSLGYCFNFDHHGQGYATEGCSAAVSDAFERLGADKVVTNTAVANRPSCRLLERLGLKKTGESTGSFWPTEDGKPIEFVSCTYAISRREWELSGKNA